MYFYEVAPNQIVRKTADVFTYHHDSLLQSGQLATIEVGKKHLVGVVMRQVEKPAYETKELIALELPPLPQPLVELAQWLAQYYKTPLATVLQTILPRGLTKTRRRSTTTKLTATRDRTHFLFNDEQQQALATLTDDNDGTYLLQGITGSGKTAVYIEMARALMERGKSVIVLVPEIALTSQTIAEFSHHFDNILVTHSGQTEAERHIMWQKALTEPGPQLVIGPRSALFTPLKNLGAIIIDEAHEPSFKQEQSPRYSALRAATMLGRFHKAKVVFGSATPLVSDRYIAEQAGRPILRLTKLARPGATTPSITLIDMTKRANFHRHRFLSDALLRTIDENLISGHQTLIFHNRRGSASTTLCDNCGWTALCPNCFVPLTLHADKYELRCHICDHREAVPSHCPVCQHTDIIFKGIGTKLIETELNKIFAHARIARFDSDNDAEKIEERYNDLYGGNVDIIIGTQVVAKGLDLPKLRSVGVIQADSGLAIPDYSSAERTFELLAQVIGRVGRNEHNTSVIVQTYQPAHPSVALGLAQNYEAFYLETLEERRRAHFPPFTYLLKLTAVYKTEAGAVNASKKLAATLRQKAPAGVQVLGPTPSFYERLHGNYRWQLVVKSPRREYLLALLEQLPPTNWQFELDPTSLL